MAKIILVAVFLTLLASVSAPWAGEQELAASDLLKCMKKCVQTYGKNEKDTCKLQCSQSIPEKSQNRDCMAIYKACRKGCSKDKVCKKSCRKAKNNCV